MSEYFLVGLGIIILFGIAAQWLAWRFHLPSILLLLLLGIMAGPILGLVDTDNLFGNLLFPFVSLSVAIILFEGGLSLRFSEFRAIGSVIRNLVTIGALMTWLIISVSAYYLLHLQIELAILFGAILIVTGPTVILPLLRQVRPKGNLYAIAKWEGILIDPVGAVIAVLVFEEIISGGFAQFSTGSVTGLATTLIVGFGLGWLASQVIILLLRKYWIPDFLHNSTAIMIVITTFIISNIIQHESGLLTVTISGILLANQNKVSIKHIIEFKENLRVILISSLFIILAARLKLTDLAIINGDTLIFLIILVLVARPLCVYVSTIGQNLDIKEKLFLSWFAPRGIVAAAISSIFALELTASGYADAGRLIPLTFIVIMTTVTLYGLSAVPLARFLKLSEPNPQGILFVGIHRWSIGLSLALNGAGFRTLLIDSNPDHLSNAHKNNVEAQAANILAEDIVDQLNLQGIGRLFAMTANDEVNALASLHFQDIFGRSEVYQLPYTKKNLHKEQTVSINLRGRRLFRKDMTYSKINQEADFFQGIKILALQAEEDILFISQEKIIPLILIDTQNNLVIYTDDHQPSPSIGMKVIYLTLA